MNRDDIIDWVAQVDMAFLKRIEPWNMFDKYEAFAALVASAERKRLAKWVGLTDEEIQECLQGLPTQTIDVYARRIEAKLKEKNT